MAMIKRAKSGQIEEMVNKENKVVTAAEINSAWPDAQIKDVLEVPVTSEHILDIDLDEQDGDEIAVRV